MSIYFRLEFFNSLTAEFILLSFNEPFDIIFMLYENQYTYDKRKANVLKRLMQNNQGNRHKGSTRKRA